MEKKLSLLFLFFSLFIKAKSASLDGTASPVYKADHYTFAFAESVTGFVKLAGGFTIPSTTYTTFNTSIPISGPVDLRSTGELRLGGDIYFDSSVSFSSGGLIKPNGHTVYLTGDFSIPENSILELTSDGIIDGMGHTLLIDAWSQLLIDPSATVTLRNLHIKNVVNGQIRPLVRCCSSGSSIIFDNVILELNTDFDFTMGNIFVENDFIFTGTTRFIYRSFGDCTVCPHSTFYFGQDSSFEYFPSSTDMELIRLNNDTSSIYFDGSNLVSSSTGMRLVSGKMILDNAVTMSNTHELDINSTASVAGKGIGTVYDAKFSKNGDLFAVAGSFGINGILIYSWDGETLTAKSMQLLFLQFLTLYALDWIYNDKYIAVGGGSGIVSVLYWDGSNYTEKATVSLSGNVYSVSWSPDGKYLAAAGSCGSDDVTVYSWDGSNLTKLTSKNLSSYARSASWTNDGKYLVVCGANSSDDVIVYSWDGSALTQVASDSFGSYGYSLDWNPESNLLAVAGENAASDLKIYYWNESALDSIYSQDLTTTSTNPAVAWSNSGRYLAVVETDTLSSIYEWTGSYLNRVATLNFPSSSASDVRYNISWRPDDRQIVLCGKTSSEDFRIYDLDYSYNEFTPSFNNAIIFGDSSKGSDYDLDAKLLSGARVEINGFVWDDSAV